MQCVLYARVSTGAQAERQLSIPAQLLAMRRHAQSHGWVVLEEFVEAGISGRTTERQALQRLLRRCKDEPKVDVVLVHKVDRLARNLTNHIAIRAYLAQHKVRLVSLSEGFDDSISGHLVENIMASLAEFYSANLAVERWHTVGDVVASLDRMAQRAAIEAVCEDVAIDSSGVVALMPREGFRSERLAA